MPGHKSFDCVEMKNRIQRQLREEYKTLTDEQRRERIARDLGSSDDPVARKWLSITNVSRSGKVEV